MSTSSRPTNGGTETDSIDWGYHTIRGALALVALWLLLMPWTTSIAITSMNRFHLKTRSFWLWAAMQPIPSMYNFANTTEVRSLPPTDDLVGLIDPLVLNPLGFDLDPLAASPANRRNETVGVIAQRTLNHFPARDMTWATARHRWLQARQDRWFIFRSTYRGHTVESQFHLQPDERGGYLVLVMDNDS
ncbi:MAG: hypothetical protein AAGD07_03340 [Planctomycetota bacterium]